MSPEIINQVGQILQQGKDLMSNPAVSTAFTGFVGWLKNAFSGNKRAKERLELIEKLQANEETINQLKTNLDDLLYENDELKKQLEEKVKEVQEVMQKAGVNITKTNTMNVTGNGNISIQDAGNGSISINTGGKSD